LRQVRLAKVREELLSSDGGTTVTDVALKYGFAHYGRFSRYYRALFSEAPAVTLRRSRLWLRGASKDLR
jgi:transcriptional regulator GlxA family with amidase domain